MAENPSNVLTTSLWMAGIFPNDDEPLVDERLPENFQSSTEKITGLRSIPFEQFMKNGLTSTLISEIENEYKEKCLHQYSHEEFNRMSCVQFLHRYDVAMTTTLTEHFANSMQNVYADENYSLTNFSSKFMHDLNMLCTQNNIGHMTNPMKEYMKDVGQFLKQNIGLCRKMGVQNEKHNLIGLYYRLYMVHLLEKKKKRKVAKKPASYEMDSICIPGSDHIFYPLDLFQNITLLLFYAMIHVENAIGNMALFLFSQFISRMIVGMNITVSGHNAAHVAVMCEDLCGMTTLMNREALWFHPDAEGLLPMENAMLAMLYTQTNLSIAVFIASCIKSGLTIYQNVYVSQLTGKRMQFVHDIFVFILTLDSRKCLDIYSQGFLELYGNIWQSTNVIQSISNLLDLYCTEKEALFNSLAQIKKSMFNDTFMKSSALSILSQLFLCEQDQRKGSVLTNEFATLASIPIVLEDIKARVIYSSPFGSPRTVIYSSTDPNNVSILSIDSAEYSAYHFAWSTFFKQIAHFYDYRLISGSALNDSDSIYAYGYLMGMFQFYEDVLQANQILKQKFKKISGNSKHAKSIKRKHVDN